MFYKVLFILMVFVTLQVAFAPPVDKKKEVGSNKNKTEELDDYGLEYGRYLQQVVQALEEDKDFAKKLENISSEQIRSGNIAKELEFVKHNVRSKLDELKRIEVDRLRKLIQEQMERTELGLYRDEDGHLLNSPDGRRWRTIPGRMASEGLNRNKGIKIPGHLDVENPHSFEIEDLKKLIQTATSDLEQIDKKRREEFKKYELEKEATYRDSLKNMTDNERKEAVKHHEEIAEKHKDHPKVHHPGSKDQLQQVWEDQDHLPKDEFNPKTFFAMHDINGDGHLDVEEVEAILIPEIKKMYNPDNSEDDPAEMEEEFHRMREHIFNETDLDKDSLISLNEFLKMTEKQEFQKDEGWKGLDEQEIFSESELEEYMRQRQMHPDGQYYGDPRMYYDVNSQHGVPPNINYQIPPGGMPPQPGYPQGQVYPHGAPMQGHANPQQYQQMPQQQFQQGYPQQQFQQGQHQQQYQHGQPQQQYHQQGQPQQQFQQGQPQQQYHQGQPQQQYHQGQPQQQYQQGQLQQQYHQGQPQQHQQGQPQQQYQHGQPQLQEQLNQVGNNIPLDSKVVPPPQNVPIPPSKNSANNEDVKVSQVSGAKINLQASSQAPSNV